ncbi:MAG: hypothetical protein EPN82_05985 [Bacteroidetes bacterium]|nr:MAG: hypothetical protein EPN82_05985 [Bacteroidota bacterium]
MNSTEKKIASIIGNRHLAFDIHHSISKALSTQNVFLKNCDSVWNVFEYSLNAAIRDIELHPKGKLLKRLIEFGPLNPDDPETLYSDNETTLSDPECGTCIEFIYSHMVNRFKGELAELLCIEPCIDLINILKKTKNYSDNLMLYFGETIKEHRKSRIIDENNKSKWGAFTKGADGLIVENTISNNLNDQDSLNILGVIEVKSMIYSPKKIIEQINSHVRRLAGGLKLNDIEFSPEQIVFNYPNNINKNTPDILHVIAIPSNWKVSRKWEMIDSEHGRKMIFPEMARPPYGTQIIELEPNLWKITLNWSEDSLNQAAYEMTYWYMSQIGTHVYQTKSLPKGWEYMTPQEAGCNAIRMMLYYIQLRYLSERQGLLATKLYNVYCFGYPVGADSKVMLWPEDFNEKD